MKIQVGANDGQTITIDLKKIDSSTLKLTGFNVNGKAAVDNAKATDANLTTAGFTQGVVDSNGNSTWTKSTTTNFDAATAVNVLAAVKDGSTINYTGTGNGLGIAATSAYTYHDSTKSYTFDSTGAAVAGAASSLQGTFGTDTNTAKITIDGSAQEVNIAKDGKITDTDE